MEVIPAGADPHAGPLVEDEQVQAVVLSAVHQAQSAPGDWAALDTIKSVLWGRGEKGALGVVALVLDDLCEAGKLVRRDERSTLFRLV